jgi:DNA-binding response OmpR family regulator
VPDKVLSLELDADDYISKPFDPRELVDRVKSIIRRIMVNELPIATLNTVSFGDWTFEQSTLTLANNNGDSFMLSSAETEILMILLSAPRQILSRERLLSGDATSFDRSIDVIMWLCCRRLLSLNRNSLQALYSKACKGFSHKY